MSWLLQCLGVYWLLDALHAHWQRLDDEEWEKRLAERTD